MASDMVIAFGSRVLTAGDVAGRDVLEVGARVVQDKSLTLRHHVSALGPSRYVGVDIEAGYGVDEICRAEEIADRYGRESFDVVIATELLEHVEDWRPVIRQLKRVVRPGGTLLITTRSEGFPYHAWPYDYWRYSISDMQTLFDDFEIEALEPDPKEPGVFMKARKPIDYRESTPEVTAMYSMIHGGRVQRVNPARRMLVQLMHRGRRSYRRRIPVALRARVKRAVPPSR